MSVTSGFFNSIEGDRKYDAVQMSSIFDGIIMDGVLQNVGGALIVSALLDMRIQVAPGRAWFNHTWTLNDSILVLTVPPSELILDRIDAVIVDVYSNVNVRNNTIKIVSGTPSSKPQRPTLIKEEGHWQYPLAYITVASEVTSIRAANITNMVGTSDCPFVRAPLEKMTIDALVAQWKDQWSVFYESQVEIMESVTGNWDWKYREFLTETYQAFNLWFENIKDTLQESTATKLQAQIDGLKSQIEAHIGPFEGDEPPYTYTLEFPYVKTTDLVHAFVAPVEDDPIDTPNEEYTILKNRRKQLSKIDKMECLEDGKLVFTCYGKKPEEFDCWLSGFSAFISIDSFKYYTLQDSNNVPILDNDDLEILGRIVNDQNNEQGD